VCFSSRIITGMNVSVVMTVLNEGDSLRAVLDSLAAQTRAPDEIVVCDGGSRDNTLAILSEYSACLPLSVIEAPGANIAQGRNAAIRAARSPIIAVTDAGVRCEPAWLERLTQPFMLSPSPPSQTGERAGVRGLHAVAGFFISDPANVFEVALGATILPEAGDVNPLTYLPSSRSVAFLKSAWEAVGGYPEWLDYGEDVVFDIEMRKRFGPFEFAPDALVHFRPRASLWEFARQYYRYARGDGKANLFPRQHTIRYFTYLVVAPLLIYAAITVSAWLWLVGVVAGLAYMRLPLRRIGPKLRALTWPQRLLAVAYIPLIRIMGDVAKMMGYPVGVAWRLTSTNPSTPPPPLDT
jgi:glycosyltransferase involved in cell wall biosynthesis